MCPVRFDKQGDSSYNEKVSENLGQNGAFYELDEQAGAQVREICDPQSDVLYHDSLRRRLRSYERKSAILYPLSFSGRQPDF